mmetsp:Transcript_3617/g.7789  ORF Transcript_3617/g.7789 Transcript_3617/m.7789 type:complete len:153 (+) Transcript_3617:1240-1698(+)
MARTFTPLHILHIPSAFKRLSPVPLRKKSLPNVKFSDRARRTPSPVVTTQVFKVHIKSLKEIELIHSSKLSRLRYRRDSKTNTEELLERKIDSHSPLHSPMPTNIVQSKPSGYTILPRRKRVFTRLKGEDLKLMQPRAKSPLITPLQHIQQC